VHPPLTANQKRGFLAAWGGVVLDGVDSFIYALVLVPAMRDLLPASGIQATTGNLGFYGSLLFSSFLIGWGLAFLWGPLADRYGRVRVLMLAILCYSVFTMLGCVARNWWELALFRLLAGFGIGGEFVGAATFVAAGGTIVDSSRAPLANPDFAPFIQRAKDAKPDALFVFVPSGPGTASFDVYCDYRWESSADFCCTAIGTHVAPGSTWTSRHVVDPCRPENAPSRKIPRTQTIVQGSARLRGRDACVWTPSLRRGHP
jgi:hypothetical protein